MAVPLQNGGLNPYDLERSLSVYVYARDCLQHSQSEETRLFTRDTVSDAETFLGGSLRESAILRDGSTESTQLALHCKLQPDAGQCKCSYARLGFDVIKWVWELTVRKCVCVGKCIYVLLLLLLSGRSVRMHALHCIRDHSLLGFKTDFSSDYTVLDQQGCSSSRLR